MTIKHSQASLAGHRLLPLILLPAFLSQTNAFAIPKALLKRAPTCDATPGNNPILADCQAALNMMPGNGGYQTYAPNNGATPLANNLGPLFYQSGTFPPPFSNRVKYRIAIFLTISTCDRNLCHHRQPHELGLLVLGHHSLHHR